MNRPEMKNYLREVNLGAAPRYGGGRIRWYDYERRDSRVIKLQGTYELEVARYLDEVGEAWEYVGRSREHSFLLSTRQRYYPDFYLKRLDLYIDPKGWFSLENERKLKLVEKEYPGRVRVLLGETYLEKLKELLL